MERIHPKPSYAAACVIIALAISSGGCKSSSGMAGSPFMSPDRVPPPNTRAIQPGQAQPYYQGDPLPAMQSAAGPQPTAIAALPAEAETRTPSGRTLSWAQPGAAAPSAASLIPLVSAPAQFTAAPPVPQAPPVVAATEAPVGVPTDGDPLRFPLPVTQPPESAAPIASAPVLPANVQANPAAQPAQLAAAAPPSNVQLATYDTPVQFASPTQINLPVVNAPQQAASPWRSPQVAPAASTPNYAPQPVPAQQFNAMPSTPAAPQPIPPNTMAATLRAVEAPPQPGDPMPRVRMPGYVASQTSADGFRPRTSMQ